GKQRGEGHLADADAAVGEKLAAGDLPQLRDRSRVMRWIKGATHGAYSLVTVSSKFKIARQTVVHAASSGRSMPLGALSGSARATFAASASFALNRSTCA